MITNTTLQHDERNDIIIVARLINNKYYKIEFTHDVYAFDIIPYFNMCDSVFVKMIRRG